ncbi:MAG: AsmA-like C-terminal region-containing protein [Deltaproteobacteria bacterium]|nr:AsmA-like C-terminal region-containing protein [Deltaproteobacteria bacterium]
MRRYRSLIVVALLLIAVVAGLAGWLLIREVSPQFLQAELEERLSAALATTVTVENIKVSPNKWIELDAREIHAWPSEDGSGLEIPRVVGSIDPLSLLFGRLRLRRVSFDGAVLRAGVIERSPQFARFARNDAAEPGIRHPQELLRPLIALEIAVRYLLESPRLASVLDLQNARLELDPIDPYRSAPMELRELNARLVHHRFSGESRLSLRGRLMEGERDLGTIALGGERSRSGRMRISLNLESLALGISDSYVSDLGSDARVDGSMSGEIFYETPEPGSGHLEINLVCERLRSSVPTVGGGPRERTELPRADVSASLVITPQSIAVHEAVIATPQTTLRMSGMVARPVQSASLADLSLEFDDVEVSQVRHLIGWLPEIKREEAAAIVAPLKSGRLVSLRASGGASLGGWQSFLAGRTRTMPEDFRLGAELADTVIWVGESDRIEKLSGRLQWIGSRVEAVGVTALLNNTPLPGLDLVVDGFPNFFAGDPAKRQLVSGGEPLVGLGTLWSTLRPTPDADSTDAGMSIELQLDYLDHPMFLWPIRDLQLAIETEAKGLHVKKVRGNWAGVPIDGKVGWFFLPDERVSVTLSAGLPSDRPAVPIPKDSWARGRFSVGPIAGERWRQSAAHGEFDASADRVRIRKLAIDLEPSGVVDANARLHLSEVDAVPFQLSFDLKGGDAVAVAKLFGLPPNQINGDVDLAGSFDGTLLPDTSIYAKLRGLLSVSATNGSIRKKAPPVVAISEASETLEDFNPSEHIRYQNLEAVLEFHDGRLQTDALSMEGPELGVLATGGVELMTKGKPMDGKVALFLFPKLDSVLGKIPILNLILLGTDSNLVATYYHVTGPWGHPEVKPILLPGSAGPTSLVLQGVPMFVKRGFKALGSLIRSDPSESEEDPPPAESATQ